jgi:hypothetical protein
MYEIPLGIFCYADKVILLPSWQVIVNEISPVVLRANDLLFPYPKQLLAISADNWRLQNSFDQKSFRDLISFLKIRWRIQFGMSFFLLCIMVYPFLYRGYQIYLTTRKPKSQKATLSLHEKFMELSTRYAIGDRSSTLLLQFLNGPCSPVEPKTSYELEELYKQIEEKELARACSLIEEHGYLPQGEQYMDEVFTILKDRFDGRRL